MRRREQAGSIDVERVILVPILVFLLCLTIFSLASSADRPASSDLEGILYLVYLILLVGFYVLAVLLLIVRSPATAESTGLAARAAAYLGTFLPMAFAFAGGSEVPEAIAILAVALMALGMAFSVYSLAALGRSFGVEAKVRTLVQHGPYSVVRNPLYVGEIITLTGAVVFSPSWGKVAILVLVAVIQVYRALQEERLLEAHIPEYAAYKLRTKRFIPGLF